MKITHSSIVTAFSVKTVGSKVINLSKFEGFVSEAIAAHDTSKDRVPGQMFCPLPAESFETVSAGVGARTDNPDDYVVRKYRGQVDLYLSRQFAAKVESLAVIVYTVEAYSADPQVEPDEAERVRAEGATHILVAVLASAGPKAPLSPKRFTANLAGGNKEALIWSADEIRTKAREVNDYHNSWCVVAD